MVSTITKGIVVVTAVGIEGDEVVVVSIMFECKTVVVGFTIIGVVFSITILFNT